MRARCVNNCVGISAVCTEKIAVCVKNFADYTFMHT